MFYNITPSIILIREVCVCRCSFSDQSSNFIILINPYIFLGINRFNETAKAIIVCCKDFSISISKGSYLVFRIILKG